MTRDAKFVWKSALSNVHGFPFCPSDLSEPQFASLAFDEECHVRVESNGFFRPSQPDLLLPRSPVLSCAPCQRCSLELSKTVLQEVCPEMVSHLSIRDSKNNFWNSIFFFFSRRFLTHDQLVPLLSKTLNAHKPETIFPHTIYPSKPDSFTRKSDVFCSDRGTFARCPQLQILG